MCVLLLDTLRLFHKHALLWSTLTVEIRGVSGGKAAELIWGPRGSGWEESGNPRFPHHCPFLPQRRWAEEKSVPPRMWIFTVFLKSKPFTCDFPSSVTSGNILCTSSQLGLLLVTPGPFQIVFGKSRMCWFVWAATCRGRTAFRHGWTWTSDCPQGSFSLCFSVLFLFFSPLSSPLSWLSQVLMYVAAVTPAPTLFWFSGHVYIQLQFTPLQLFSRYSVARRSKVIFTKFRPASESQRRKNEGQWPDIELGQEDLFGVFVLWGAK